MHIARPPGGFFIREAETISALIDAESLYWPRLPEHWAAIKERLRFTAHREGTIDRRLGPGHRLLVVEGLVSSGIPKLRAVYRVLGDEVVIKAVGIVSPRPTGRTR